ncbi:MAG: carboxylesterase/lipase family protein [Steroidobacteraceae bacterium]
MIRACLCLLALALSAIARPSAPPPEVQIESGALAGLSEGNVQAFLGIPYAAPPLGPLRWRGPRPPAPWAGTRAAQQFSPACPQRSQSRLPYTAEYRIPGPMSEDCLTLNIWTPATNAQEHLPVLVWIHGGSFRSGSASVPIYNGHALATRGILVVTLNYRLGVLGFLAHPELTAESELKTSGNYGLLDIISALNWLKRNLPAFGGDPDRITLGGQSAGAFAIQLLESAPAAHGLFHQVIAQSGSMGRAVHWHSLSEAEERGVRYLKLQGKSSITALREVPVAQLYSPRNTEEAAPDRHFPPIADGVTVPSDADKAPVARFDDVATLTGLTADETHSFNPSMGAMARWAGSRAARTTLIQWAENRAATTKASLYLYWYDHIEPGPESARWGAFHASELPYLFETLDAAPERPFTARDREVSRHLAGYWVNFVKTGNPNGAGLPRWPAFSAVSPAVMEIGDRYSEHRQKNIAVAHP